MPKRIITFICSRTPAFLLPFLMALPAQATSFYPQPFPETVQAAPIIVRGKVGMSYADWNRDDSGGKRIYTFYELQPTEVLKGNLTTSASLNMRELGGQKDGVGLNVPGVSQFERGEDAVIFLKDRNSTGSYEVQGMMMGKYNIQKDSDGNEYLTGMGLNNFNHFSNNSAGTTVTTPTKKWTLQDLKQLIRTQADATPNTNVKSDSSNAQQASQQNNQTQTPALPASARTKESEAQTSTLTQTAESESSPHVAPIKIWIFLTIAIATLGLWQYRKTRRKN
jgi:hypothetical protein